VIERAAEPIQPPDYECIAWPEVVAHGLLKAWPFSFSAAGGICENGFAASPFEGISLEVKGLILRRNAGITYTHADPLA
jgi:hypothetical protein